MAIKDITLGQYFPGDSVIHRLDPRVKILWTMYFVVLLFFIENFSGFIIMALFIALIVAKSKINAKFIIRGLKPLLFLVIFTATVNIFMTGTTPIFTIGPFKATWEGLGYALIMVARLTLLVSCTSMLTFTTSPIMLTDGIELLLKPLRRVGVPSHEIAMMMTIAIRFIPTILEETDKIMKAQTARGADFESGNIIKRAKALIPLLVPLFVSAFRRADELAIAMECRCYRGGDNRTRMKELSFGRADTASLFVGFAVGALLIASRFMPV